MVEKKEISSDWIDRRSFIGGMGATGLALAIAPAFVSIGPRPNGAGAAKPAARQYVFASDPRAKQDGFAVLPG